MAAVRYNRCIDEITLTILLSCVTLRQPFVSVYVSLQLKDVLKCTYAYSGRDCRTWAAYAVHWSSYYRAVPTGMLQLRRKIPR